ncbi:MAG: signal recognition particle-docking protein FtsY [Neomegalonema sp.]|nr:signal recognition particle-docking protein FtsY [Neomegalonema sp.]
MSFFRRLKDRLLKSSSKIDEGLDAMMESGEEEAVEPQHGAQEAPLESPQEAPEAPPLETPVQAPVESPELAPVEDPAEDPAELPASAPEMPDEAGAQHAHPSAPVPSAPVPSTPVPSGPPPAPEAEKRPGFGARMLGALTGRAPGLVEKRRVLDDDFLEELEELLISTDLGVETALRVAANIAEGRYGSKVGAREIKELLAGEIAQILEPVARPLPLYGKKPQVVLVVGVNGSGKTTTIGKIASQLKSAGKSVMIAAGDTFRAAAVEQLQVWGDRAGVPVFKIEQGGDPASLAYDALSAAREQSADILLIDTAGRLQNRSDLMEELSKIVRVIRKIDPDAPHNTLLVLDATTGQNAINQAEVFGKVADVSGLVMTKLDGTARGGVLVALADKIGLPIHAIGVGESIEDLQPFDPMDFARALTGADR